HYFMIENARHWALEYHLDGLRLDAIQAIEDDDEPNIVTEIAIGVRQKLKPDRHFVVIAEDEFNRPFLVQPFDMQQVEKRGYGLDAIYADDFHHQVHVAVTGEKSGYYSDYSGSAPDLARTMEEGWWFSGQLSNWRKRNVGESAAGVAPQHLVWCLQNHDQVGNRPYGERLNRLVGGDAYRAASALLLLSPYTPLLFLGQEWGASTPFPYFTDHVEEIGQGVTEGRMKMLRRLYPDFDSGRAPLPQAEETFAAAKLKWTERRRQPHAGILALYADLLRLRRDHPALRRRERGRVSAAPLGERGLALRRCAPDFHDDLLVIASLRGRLRIDLGDRRIPPPPPGAVWLPILDSEDAKYGGRGPARLSEDGVLEMRTPGAVVLGLRS